MKNKYYTFSSFTETGLVKHVFTDRKLNLNLNTKEDIEKVYEDFESLCSDLEINLDDTVISSQTHKTKIKVVDEKDKGKGLIRERDYKDIDGLVTDKEGIALVTFYADCVPLFFLDKKKKVAGVAHAGWRGTVGKIGKEMISTMIDTYHSDPRDILVGIGPSIGECCYEIGEDTKDEFEKSFTDLTGILKQVDEDKWTVNLWKANEAALLECGVPLENISKSELCTSCNNDTFFSYRAEDGKTGRMAAVIVLV